MPMGRKGSMPSAAQAARRAAAKARTNMPAEKKMESDKKKQESENRKKKESAPAALIQMMTGPIPQVELQRRSKMDPREGRRLNALNLEMPTMCLRYPEKSKAIEKESEKEKESDTTKKNKDSIGSSGFSYAKFDNIDDVSSDDDDNPPRASNVPPPDEGVPLTFLAWSSEAAPDNGLFRPCVDCGVATGRFCDSNDITKDDCYASKRLPMEVWNPHQRTPFCSACEKDKEVCRFCRQERMTDMCEADSDSDLEPETVDCKLTYDSEIFTPYRLALRIFGATKNSTRKWEQNWYYIVSMLLIWWAKQIMEPRRSGSD